MHKPME